MKKILLIFLLCVTENIFAQGLLSPVWKKAKFSSIGQSTEAWGVDVDAAGNVYWAANSDSTSSNNWDIFCYKYNANGNTLWSNPLFFGGTAAQQSFVLNAQDTFLYVGGRNAITGFNSDMLLLKVNKATGSLIWSKTYDFGNNGYDEMDGLEIGNDGIYCGGWGQAIATGSYKIDIGLMKLNFNGDTIWKNHFGQSSTAEHQDGHFVVDNSTIFAAGLWGGTGLVNIYNGWDFIGKFSKSNGSFIDSTLFGYHSTNFLDAENALGMTTDGTYLYILQVIQRL